MIKPLLIYIEVLNIDGEIKFSTDPCHKKLIKDNLYELSLNHNITQTTRFKINLEENLGTKSHLIIRKIVLDGTPLDNFDTWAKYIVYSEPKPISAFGYMERKGHYIINIHQSAMIHNFMAYFKNISRD